MVVMEAMARSCPVIATDVGGVSDLVENGVTGRLVPPGDVDALAAALCEAAAGGTDIPAMGVQGRIRLEREFGHAQWLERHLQLYASLRGLP